MVKAIVSSVVVVLMIGSVAGGGIIQRQTMDVGLTSAVILPPGPNARAATEQGVLLADLQGAGNAYGTVAIQGQGVLIGQASVAEGRCGGLSAIQSIDGGGLPIGAQEQRIGDCCERSTENQALGFAASQTLEKTNCARGRVEGEQEVGAAQVQFATNENMTMGEGALIIAGQKSSITGGIGMVSTTMVVDTSQSQTVQALP